MTHTMTASKAIGTLQDWRYTRSGYQISTIDGVDYKTLWDAVKLPLSRGCRVEFEISTRQPDRDPYPQFLLAKILRVVDKNGETVPMPDIPRRSYVITEFDEGEPRPKRRTT